MLKSPLGIFINKVYIAAADKMDEMTNNTILIFLIIV